MSDFEIGYNEGIKMMQLRLETVLKHLGKGPYYSYETLSDVITNIHLLRINGEKDVKQREVLFPPIEDQIKEIFEKHKDKSLQIMIDYLMKNCSDSLDYKDKESDSFSDEELVNINLYIALKNYKS